MPARHPPGHRNVTDERRSPMQDGTLKVTPIESKQPQPQATFSITCTLDGFPIVIEVQGNADSLRAMIGRLKAIGAQPPTAGSNSALPPTDDAPVCEFHGKMKRGNYGWFCPKKMGD